jgi:hypothetical protein
MLPSAPFSVPLAFGTQQVAISDSGGDAAMCARVCSSFARTCAAAER